MTVPPSVLYALLGTEQALGVTELRRRLPTNGSVECEPCQATHGRWAMWVRLADRRYRVALRPAISFDDAHVEAAMLRPEQLELARQSRFAVSIECQLGDDPQAAFQAQLALLLQLTPQSELFVDANACRVGSRRWAESICDASVPPSPHALYTVHAVREGDQVWLHTHGLDRCGSAEVDIVGVQADELPLMGQLLQAVAAMFMEQGAPSPGTCFEAGRSLPFALLPWSQAIAKLDYAGPGDANRDEFHQASRGVLVVPPGGVWPRRYRSVGAHLKALCASPVLYISDRETRRMAALARARLCDFASWLQTEGANPAWRFLAKMAYEVDGGCSREHLWFEVHHIENNQLEATLLNCPHQVSSLRQGDCAVHDAERITDWAIITPNGQVGPDTVYRLGEVEPT